MGNRRRHLSGFIAGGVLLLLPFSSVGLPGSQPEDTFPLELDHVLIWVTKGAPEAKAVEDAGLHMLAETSKHVGQGTASRVFVFENAYLELIWIDDEQAASKNAARTGIDMEVRANWKRSKASPFGIGLHRIRGTTNAIPFPVMEYRAEWMKADTSIQFARAVSRYQEPMYFVVPEYLAIPDAATRERLKQTNPAYATMLKHRLGISRLTHVKISTVAKKLTSTAEVISGSGVVRIETGKAPLMELIFDNGAREKTVDLRPQLPLIIKY